MEKKLTNGTTLTLEGDSVRRHWKNAEGPSKWVAVRPVGEEKTYLGILVGEVARGLAIREGTDGEAFEIREMY